MLSPPPISTLFPYTTLFRSHGETARPDLRESSNVCTPAIFVFKKGAASRMLRSTCDSAAKFTTAHVFCSLRILDRKSTRLNSSHVEISYAVFCLKKKKYEIE